MISKHPAYFDQFQCIAGRCPDSCCKEWEVAVDPDAAEMYLDLPGELGDAIRDHLYREDGHWYFAIEDGRCPMWRSDGLCRIQAELGHDSLCHTCRQFPRLTHDYGTFLEQGLELSCPEAAKWIFSGQTQWVEQEVPGGEEPEYDPDDMSILLETRQQVLSILTDETRTIPETLVLMLLYGYRAQNRLDGGEDTLWNPEEELAFGRSVAKAANPAEIIDFYKNLEILTEKWRQKLENPHKNSVWDPRQRLLARYGVERYWLQAISDLDLVGRVKLVVLSCILTHHLGGELLETAQIYAKEIENSANNVDDILDGAYTHPALTDDKILGILLEV